jgi:predicted Fe-Mo cluster-binding NifX family protein
MEAGERLALMSLTVNLVVAGMKYFLGVFSGILHYEPVSKDTMTIALPMNADHVSLSEHFGEAPVFLFLKLRSQDGCLVEEKFLPNHHCQDGTGKGILVSEWLISLSVDEVVAAKSFAHKGPYYVFADAGVQMRQTDDKDLDHIKAWLVSLEAQTLPVSEAVVTK